jgi:hypothetical protein
MKSNRKGWLKGEAALAVGLFLVATAGNVLAQREEKRGPNSGNSNWGGSFPLRQTALQAGYDAGIKAGRNDHSRGERFNFTDESDYKKATKGYNSRLGDRSLYQRYFRAGFESGYRDSWNGY